MNNIIKINNFKISRNDPVFIIAEVGVNHNGDLELAKKLILDLFNSRIINNVAIENINKLGNKILLNTFYEIEKIIKNENFKT